MKYIRILTYICEEVRRQGHDLAVADDGGTRVQGMWAAWQLALQNRDVFPTEGVIITLGQMIEPEANHLGYRPAVVMVGGVNTPEPEAVPDLMTLWLAGISELTLPTSRENALIAYRGFEQIHPFMDGNGRTGKVLLNWLAGTLENPFFPPRDFWGIRIQNP